MIFINKKLIFYIMSIPAFRPTFPASLPIEGIKKLANQALAFRLHQSLRVHIAAIIVFATLVTTAIYHYLAQRAAAENTDAPDIAVVLVPDAAASTITAPGNATLASAQSFFTELQRRGPERSHSPSLQLATGDEEPFGTIHIDLEALCRHIRDYGIKDVIDGLIRQGLDPLQLVNQVLITPEMEAALQQAFQAYRELPQAQLLALEAPNLDTGRADTPLLPLSIHQMPPVKDMPDELTRLADPEGDRIRQELQEAMEAFEPPEGTHIVVDRDEEFYLIELDAKDYQDPDNYLAQLQPPRANGVASHLGIFGSKAIGASCYLTLTRGPIFDDKAFEQAALAKDSTGDLWRSLKPINKRQCLTSGAVDTYSQWLMTKYSHLKISLGSTHKVGSIRIPKVEEGKTLYAIPVVLAGVRSHIVTFIYDSENHILEYYDSKGWRIRECQNYLIDKFGEKTTLLNMYLEIMTAYSTEEKGAPKVWENLHEHQSDFYNCGVYVLDRILRLAILGDVEGGINYLHENETAESGLTFHEANSFTRRDILESLIPELKKLTANVPSYAPGILGAAASTVGSFFNQNCSLEDLLARAEDDLALENS